MSQPMKSAKETLDAITAQGGLPEEQGGRVKWASKVVGQNLNKIWLRTKVGKPMAESMQETAEDALRKLEAGASQEEVRAAVDAVEARAKEIDEESRRRSMVVT
jgi:hypothetical protein